MKTTKQLLGAVSAFALVAMTSAPVLAQGTTAGSIIRNEVSVSYNVGNITQNAEIASDEFTVDQRVNVTVGFIGSATVVNPGQEGAAIAFDVTNLSNDTIDLALQFVPREHLIACTNCGLAPMSREVAMAKLEALGKGAALALQRYGG